VRPRMEEIVDSAWRRSCIHFSRYLPAEVSRWVVLHDSRFHAAIVQPLSTLVPCLVLDLCGDAQVILDAEQESRSHSDVGLVAFLVPDASRPFSEGMRLALKRFDGWPQQRTKICFDVA